MVNTNKVPLRRIEGINNYKTNCITEIPQDIKLELADGVLTLKAGSKVYVPNGFEEDGTTPKFDEIKVNTDLTMTYTEYNNTYFVVCNNLGTGIVRCNLNGSSGSIQPETTVVGDLWYDTTTNIIKRYNGTTWIQSFSFPITTIIVSNNIISSIDQVFNGFGYIGSVLFGLPGVKVLNPNGRNEDGTLNNEELTTSSVFVRDYSSFGNYTFVTWLNKSNTFGSQIKEYFNYDEIINGFVQSQDGVIVYKAPIIEFDIVYSKITNFTFKFPFREVDQNDFPQLFEDNLKQKIKVVSDLPSNPEIGVLYYVKE